MTAWANNPYRMKIPRVISMKTALSSKNCMVGEEEEGTINNGRNERKKTDNFGLRRLTRIAFQTTDPSFLFLTCSAENCSDPVSLHMVHAKNNRYAAPNRRMTWKA